MGARNEAHGELLDDVATADLGQEAARDEGRLGGLGLRVRGLRFWNWGSRGYRGLRI